MKEVETRRMCPNCRAFISQADRVCPYCEFQIEGPRQAIGARRRPPSDLIAGFIPHARFTTSLILLLNLLLFLASMFDERLINAAMSNGQLIYGFGQWWRLVTAGFFHGGVFHILMNSWVLFDLGCQVEDVYGSERLIVFYFAATVGGFALSAFLGHNAVGASAGIYGLLGVMIALGRQARNALGDHIAGLYTRWALFGLVMSFLPGIDLAAHVGGLATGFVLAFATGLPRVYDKTSDTLWRWAAYACIALTAASFLKMLRLFLRF